MNSQEKFDLGEHIMQAIEFFAANYSPLLLIAFVNYLVGAPSALLLSSDSSGLVFLGAVLFPLTVIMGIISQLATIHFIHSRYASREIAWQEAFRLAMPDSLRAVTGASLSIMIIGVGIILLVVPAVYWGTLFVFSLYFIALEKQEVIPAFKSSAAIVKGRFWMTLNTNALLLLINLMLMAPFFIFFKVMGTTSFVQTLVINLLAGALSPFFVIVYYRFFCWMRDHASDRINISVYEKKD